MSKLPEAKHHIEVKVDMDELDLTSAETKATYKEIQDWVQEMYGFHVTNLNNPKVMNNLRDGLHSSLAVRDLKKSGNGLVVVKEHR